MSRDFPRMFQALRGSFRGTFFAKPDSTKQPNLQELNPGGYIFNMKCQVLQSIREVRSLH